MSGAVGYIEQSLAASETLLAKTHFPWLYRAFAYVTFAVFIAAAAYVMRGLIGHDGWHWWWLRSERSYFFG